VICSLNGGCIEPEVVHHDVVQPQWTGGVFSDYMLPMPLTRFKHARPERVMDDVLRPPFFLLFVVFSLGSFLCLCQFSSFILALFWQTPKGSGLHSMWSFGRHLSISLLLLVSSFSFGFIVCYALVFFSSILRVSFGIYISVECGTGISTAYRAGDEISLRRACSALGEADPLRGLSVLN